jgi:hypothetical protein
LVSTTVSNITGVGESAGYNNSSGLYNTYLGYQAGFTNSTANGVTAVGFQSLKFATGAAQTAVGESTLYNSTGTYNTAIGYNAGVLMTSGSKNTFLGAFSGNNGGLLDLRTASNNVVLSDGDGNVAVVYQSSGVTNQNVESKGNLVNAYNRPVVYAGTGVAVNCVEAVRGFSSGIYGWSRKIYFTLSQLTGSSKSLRLTFTRAQDSALVGFRMLVTGEYPSDSITQYIARVATAGGSGGTYSSSNYATGDNGAGSWTNPGGTADFYCQSAGAFIADTGGIQGIIEIVSPLDNLQAFSSITIGYA